MSEYLKKRQGQKSFGTLAPDSPKKKYAGLKPISDKKAAAIAADKAARGGGEDTVKEKWFRSRQRELKGICQCGCKQPYNKKDELHFRSSCCHIFPQRLFPSVQYHAKNFIERCFWGGCHTNLDEQGMGRWPAMADWSEIKEKFHILAPLLTDEERASKFYRTIEELVYKF